MSFVASAQKYLMVIKPLFLFRSISSDMSLKTNHTARFAANVLLVYVPSWPPTGRQMTKYFSTYMLPLTFGKYT